MKKILILGLLVLLLTGCGKTEIEDVRTLNNYKADEVCKKQIVEELDEVTVSSDSNVYLMLDEFNFVKTAIYQSVTPLDYVSSYTYETYEYIRNLYSNIDGVKVIYYDIKDSLVLEIRYDYDTIDLTTFRNSVGELLDKDSLLGREKSIPVTLERFKSIELDGYECEVKN